MIFRIFICFLIGLSSAYGQQKYPQGYFQSPLDIPLYLSGTFGELRSNHFHSGLDIKTKGSEGFKVLSIADGYVSRIKVSHWGYGKALYITHPNGYTSVYGHLKKFSPEIEAYLKKHQYKEERFEIELHPSKKKLRINKGEVIAYSGNTGGSAGPHLHFEIRDKNSKPINPMLFGITVKDTQAPIINTLVAYSLDSISQVNQSAEPLQINFKTQKNGVLLADKVTASGIIGFGINAYDRLNGALNKNGLYSLEMKVNGKRTYFHEVKTFSFKESKYINLLIDYTRYADLRQRIQRCYVLPENKLSIYGENINNGKLIIKNSLNYKVEIIAKDFAGNKKVLVIPIEGKADKILIPKKISPTNYFIKSKEFNKFSESGITIAFPKNTFYEDVFLDFKVKKGVAYVHKKNIPLRLSYTLTFDVSNYPKEERKQLFIANYSSKGYPIYRRTVKKENTFYIKTKALGKFAILKDDTNPKIKLSNFKNKQRLTNFTRITLKISDDLSGIKSYRGEIDGEWILLEYSPKKGTLTYDFSDRKFKKKKHLLKIIVEDNVGNTNTLEATFYRNK